MWKQEAIFFMKKLIQRNGNLDIILNPLMAKGKIFKSEVIFFLYIDQPLASK